MNYEYHPTNNINYDEIDFVAIVNAMGIKIRNPKMPVLLNILTDEERLTRASECVNSMSKYTEVPKNYVRDSLYDEVMNNKITSLDRAWIVFHTNRLLKGLGTH